MMKFFKQNAGAFILPLASFIGALFTGNEAMQEVFDESDFGTLTGTLRSAEEYQLKRSKGMTFFINESHVRFRLGPTSYGIFDDDSFFKNVRIGNRITLTALQEDLTNPTPPNLGEQIDTTFVYGLKDSRVEYLNLKEKLSQSDGNKIGMWVLSFFFGIGGCFFLWVIIKSGTDERRKSSSSNGESDRSN